MGQLWKAATGVPLGPSTRCRAHKHHPPLLQGSSAVTLRRGVVTNGKNAW